MLPNRVPGTDTFTHDCLRVSVMNVFLSTWRVSCFRRCNDPSSPSRLRGLRTALSSERFHLITSILSEKRQDKWRFSLNYVAKIDSHIPDEIYCRGGCFPEAQINSTFTERLNLKTKISHRSICFVTPQRSFHSSPLSVLHVLHFYQTRKTHFQFIP